MATDGWRVRRVGIDASTYLTIYLVLLWAVPTDLRITALGSAGSLALLWGILGFLWWCADRLRSRQALTWGLGPMPTVVFAFAISAALSYVAAMTRGVPGVEGNTADSGLLRVAAWTGVLLMASDGLRDQDRLLVLLRRMVVGAGLLGLLGLAQFVSDQPLIDWVTIPGLSSDGMVNVQGRAGFTRPAGTAVHPLEFGVVMCMVLPLAVTLALHERHRSALVRWMPVTAIVGASVLSVSRSSLIGVVAGMLVLAPTWPSTVRRAAVVATIAVGALVFLVVPGMATTLRDLFLGIGQDESTLSRTSTWGLAFTIASRFAVLGRGLGTFVPEYQILDNQFLLLLIELGALGLATFLLVLGMGIACGLRGRRSRPPGLERDLGQALAASIFAGSLLFLFFDGLSFPMAAGTLFLILGLSGAYERLNRDGEVSPARRAELLERS